MARTRRLGTAALLRYSGVRSWAGLLGPWAGLLKVTSWGGSYDRRVGWEGDHPDQLSRLLPSSLLLFLGGTSIAPSLRGGPGTSRP